MAETIANFQSQLSGVMETVFKAAIFEITRLVEDSFLEEMNRCREQVESLKKRLKWSEGRRNEGDGRGRCKDCGRRGVSGEKDPGESALQSTFLCIHPSMHASIHHPYMHASIIHPFTQGENLDKLKLLSYNLQPTNLNKFLLQLWFFLFYLSESSDLPGTSKSYSDHKFNENTEASFSQIEPVGDGSTGNPSDPHFLNRSGMENMGCFGKNDYGGEGQDRTEPQTYLAGILQNRMGTASSPAGSPSRAEIGVTGEFSCLLINEEGYLQDTNELYPGNASGASSLRPSLRGQDVHFDCPSDSKPDTYEPSGAYRDRGGRRQSCSQPSMSSESASPKIYKHGHKGPGQGPSYKCMQCGKTFAQASNFKIHQKLHCRPGFHFCSQCGKQFPSYNDQKTHECSQACKPYCCSMCGKKFSRLWNLKLHWRIHTQEKPHRCTMCDKSFTRADILKVHQRTHTGERPYICSICGLSFKRLDHLKSHQRKHMTDL
uniref:C2H2-type domain-containing protein n=1 Tax=Takifugu rubripes TaxID=31033 RepID=A0A3B5K1H6_TAKRU